MQSALACVELHGRVADHADQRAGFAEELQEPSSVGDQTLEQAGKLALVGLGSRSFDRSSDVRKHDYHSLERAPCVEQRPVVELEVPLRMAQPSRQLTDRNLERQHSVQHALPTRDE